MTDWPGSLPGTMIVNGLSIERVSGVIISKPDIGPAMARRRFTQLIELVQGSMVLTPAQWDTLQTFFDTTIGGGVDRFNFTHPITGDSVVAMFVADDAQCCAVQSTDGILIIVGLKMWLER